MEFNEGSASEFSSSSDEENPLDIGLNFMGRDRRRGGFHRKSGKGERSPSREKSPIREKERERNKCSHCGGGHSLENCYFKEIKKEDNECKICRKKGHFTPQCKERKPYSKN